MSRAWPLLLVVLALAPSSARAQGAAPAAPVERLREVEEAAAKSQQIVRQLEEKRAGILDTIERLERTRLGAELEAQKARKSVADSQAALARAKEHERKIESERWRLTRDMAPRLDLRYRLRGASYLRVLVEAESVGDFLWRRRVLDRLLGADLDALARLDALRNDAEQARKDVETRRDLLRAAENTAVLRAAEARREASVLQSVLAGIERQRETKQAALEELEKAREGLVNTIGTGSLAEGLGGFGNRRGKVSWPTAGRVEVRFGKRLVDAKFKAVVQQKGFDIRAAAGTPVWAVHVAQVAFAGWFKGFGNLVVLDHGEGYFTLYAHLEELPVKKGDRVREGQSIGTVGETGSLKGPYLYFEIRSGQKALNPAQWLAPKK